MADRRVKVVFSAEIQNYKAAMEAAAKSTEKVKKSSEDAGTASEKASKVSADAAKVAAAAAKKHADALDSVGRNAAIGGAAVLAGVGLAVKSYADFDKQMSAVDAATHETAGNMQLLRDAAVKAGADTAFSASEAAQGIEEMAKAGVSTKDILGGGLTGALSLAAAGSLGVGDAAEIAASAMTQFKLSGDKLPHVADLLAAGAGKAQGSVADMGAALNQTGLVAASTGLTIEETTGGLAAFASAGLTGSDAGTSFKSMLQRLTPQSLEAKNKMTELGISAYDAQGQFIGLSKFSENLKTSMAKLTPEARAAAMGVIFGSDAVRAANVLYENGAEGIQKWTNNVNDAGYAADTAARKQDNLSGDLEKLGGSFDTVLIQSGSGANETLRGLVQNLEGVVDAVGKIPAPMLNAGLGVAAVVGGAALLGGGLITVIPKIRDTRDALNELAPAGGKARGALEKVGVAATGLGALATATLIIAKLAESDYMSKIDTGMGKVSLALAQVTANSPGTANALDSLFKDRDGNKLITGVQNLDDAMRRTFHPNRDQQFNDWGESLINGMTGVKGSSQILADSFDRLDKGLAELVTGGKPEDAAKAFENIKKVADVQGISVDELTKKFPAYGDALKKAEADAKGAAEGGDKVAGSLKDVGVNASGAAVDLVKFTEALLAAGLSELSARDAVRGFESAIDGVTDSIKTNGTTLDVHTEKGRANQAALDAIAAAGSRVVDANAKNGESQETLQGNLTATYDALVAGAGQFGITGQAAIDLAREILHVPPGVDIKSWMSDAAKRMAQETGAAADAVDGKTVNVYVNTHKTTFEQLVGLPSSIADGSRGQGLGVYAPPKATGGRLAGFADGGQLPSTGPGTDTTDGFLGISSAGVPLARVDAGEWIVNRGSSGRYNRELAAINAGTFPKLPGYADGGRAYAAQAFASRAGGSSGVTFDFSGAQFTALDPVQLRRDVVDEVTHTINTKGGMRIV